LCYSIFNEKYDIVAQASSNGIWEGERIMKKTMLIATALVAVIYIFAGCADSGIQAPAEQTPQASATPAVTEEPLFTLVPVNEPQQTQQQEPQPIYSSYAYLRRFDPQSGIAQFDYFDVLTGNDAVNYLINCEGYCSLVAQEVVARYEKTDFLEVNPDGALWDIDLSRTDIKLLYDADRSFTEPAELWTKKQDKWQA
jgi:hypothetical protein